MPSLRNRLLHGGVPILSLLLGLPAHQHLCWLSNLGGGYQGRGHVWQDFAAFQHCRKMHGMSRVHVQRMLLGWKRWDKAVSELPGLDLSDVCQQHAECRVEFVWIMLVWVEWVCSPLSRLLRAWADDDNLTISSSLVVRPSVAWR